MKPETLKAVWSEMEFGTKAPDAKVLDEMQAFANFARQEQDGEGGLEDAGPQRADPGHALKRRPPRSDSILSLSCASAESS
jgi:hypothetical protein